jgi:hypothetical protein
VIVEGSRGNDFMASKLTDREVDGKRQLKHVLSLSR